MLFRSCFERWVIVVTSVKAKCLKHELIMRDNVKDFEARVQHLENPRNVNIDVSECLLE